MSNTAKPGSFTDIAFDSGRIYERNLIIKQLDANQHIWRERVVYDALIALIKGEKK